MTPALAATILELLLRYGPEVAQMAQRMISSQSVPTDAEWDALFDRASKPYDAYIAEAQARSK